MSFVEEATPFLSTKRGVSGNVRSKRMNILEHILLAEDPKRDEVMEVPISSPPPPKVISKRKPNKSSKNGAELTRDTLKYVQKYDLIV